MDDNVIKVLKSLMASQKVKLCQLFLNYFTSAKVKNTFSIFTMNNKDISKNNCYIVI